MPEARPGTWKVQPGMSVAGAFRSWAVRPCLERLVFFLQLGVGLCVGGTAIDRRSCQRLYAGGLRCQFAKGRKSEIGITWKWTQVLTNLKVVEFVLRNR